MVQVHITFVLIAANLNLNLLSIFSLSIDSASTEIGLSLIAMLNCKSEHAKQYKTIFIPIISVNTRCVNQRYICKIIKTIIKAFSCLKYVFILSLFCILQSVKLLVEISI